MGGACSMRGRRKESYKYVQNNIEMDLRETGWEGVD
jgi:hypothetical protein